MSWRRKGCSSLEINKTFYAEKEIISKLPDAFVAKQYFYRKNLEVVVNH